MFEAKTLKIGVFMRLFFVIFFISVLVGCNQVEKAAVKPIISITDDTNRLPSKPQTKLPSCKTYCSEDQNILNHDQSGFSYLSFVNFGYRGIGRCRGHALVMQKMSILARYQRDGGCDLKDNNCIETIKEGIQKVMNFETHTFKGFNNLLDLSSVPELKQQLWNIVANTSHRYSARPVPIDEAKATTSIRARSVFTELKKRTLMGQLPYVGVKGAATGAHALLTYEVSFVGAKEVLCARDPNVSHGRAEACESYFYQEDGKVYYQRFDRKPDYMSMFEIFTDEDLRLEKYVASLQKSCLDHGASEGLCQ